jgi:hypothetical protein
MCQLNLHESLLFGIWTLPVIHCCAPTPQGIDAHVLAHTWSIVPEERSILTSDPDHQLFEVRLGSAF